MSKDLPAFGAYLADYREGGKKQGKSYSRLRTAMKAGAIDYVKVDGVIRLNKRQAENWLAADRSRLDGACELQQVHEFNSADLARLVIAVEDMAVAIRQALAAVSRNV